MQREEVVEEELAGEALFAINKSLQSPGAFFGVLFLPLFQDEENENDSIRKGKKERFNKERKKREGFFPGRKVHHRLAYPLD